MALVILAIVMFAVPPTARLWIAAIVVVMALLVKGGDTANIINSLRRKVYG